MHKWILCQSRNGSTLSPHAPLTTVVSIFWVVVLGNRLQRRTARAAIYHNLLTYKDDIKINKRTPNCTKWNNFECLYVMPKLKHSHYHAHGTSVFIKTNNLRPNMLQCLIVICMEKPGSAFTLCWSECFGMSMVNNQDMWYSYSWVNWVLSEIDSPWN